MADVAIGAICAQCKTLVACSGSFTDARLTGVCPVCKIAVTTQNVRLENGQWISVQDEAPAVEQPQAPVEDAPIPQEILPEIAPEPEAQPEPEPQLLAPEPEPEAAPIEDENGDATD